MVGVLVTGARWVGATMEITEAATATAMAEETEAMRTAEVMTGATVMRGTTGTGGMGTVTMANTVTAMKEKGTTRCNYLQCRSDSAARFQHPRRDRGFFLSWTPPFRPHGRYCPGEDGSGRSGRSGVALAVWNHLRLSNQRPQVEQEVG